MCVCFVYTIIYIYTLLGIILRKLQNETISTEAYYSTAILRLMKFYEIKKMLMFVKKIILIMKIRK